MFRIRKTLEISGSFIGEYRAQRESRRDQRELGINHNVFRKSHMSNTCEFGKRFTRKSESKLQSIIMMIKIVKLQNGKQFEVLMISDLYSPQKCIQNILEYSVHDETAGLSMI